MAAPCCGQGSIHEGTPVGRVETVHGLPAYISEAPEASAPKALIVMIPDAFGWEFVNLRLLADTYAKRSGARVYLPEFMDGNSASVSMMYQMDVATTPSSSWLTVFTHKIPTIFSLVSQFIPFLIRNRQAVAEPRIRKWFTELRSNEGANLKIGATGYCWGGKFATLLCHEDAKTKSGQPLIDAAFTAHPSNLVLPGDIEGVQKPMSIAVGDNDLALKHDLVKQAKHILEETKEKGKHEVVILPGAKHGFSVRGHPDDKKEMEQAQIAEDQVIAFFHKNIGTNA